MEVASEVQVLEVGPVFCGMAVTSECCEEVWRIQPTTGWSLSAVIEGLRALKRACSVTVLTDSEYVRCGITEFLWRWKNND